MDAALARCPTPDEIAVVDSVVTLTFEDDPTAPSLVCTAAAGSADLTYFQERAYQAILSMRRIPFDAPLPWTELQLFDWFAEEVGGVVFRVTELPYCCDKPGVIVIPSRGNLTDSWGQSWVTREPDAETVGLINSVELFLHEARHVAGFRHECGGVNDATLEEGGAWAVVYWYYTWLAEHADTPYMTPTDAPSDLYRTAAALNAESTLNTRFGCTD